MPLRSQLLRSVIPPTPNFSFPRRPMPEGSSQTWTGTSIPYESGVFRWKPYQYPYRPKKVGMLGILSLGPYSTLWSHSSHPKPLKKFAKQQSLPTKTLPRLSSTPRGSSRSCLQANENMVAMFATWFLPLLRVTQESFALFITSGFINSVWLAYNISSGGYLGIQNLSRPS